jgi:hypothetical protein
MRSRQSPLTIRARRSVGIAIAVKSIGVGLAFLFFATEAVAAELPFELERSFFSPRIEYESESVSFRTDEETVSLGDDTETYVGAAFSPGRPSQLPSVGPGSSPQYRLPIVRESDQRGASFQAFGVGMFVASTGDLLTTELGLESGFVEGNPLQRNRAVRIGAHVAVPALLYWATDRVHRSGREKTALVLRIVATLAYGIVTAHNAQMLAR